MKLTLPRFDLRSLPGLAGRPKRSGGATVLGLGLDGRRLEAAVLRRTNGSAEVLQNVTAALSLDPKDGDPVALGHEIRKHLEAAGVRERHCVFSVPLSWLFTFSVPLPELPEEDLENLIQIEAERGFPSSLDTLMVARSRYRTPDGATGVTLMGLSRDHVARIESMLRAAQLRPVSLTLGLAALETSAGPDAVVLSLVPGEEHLDLRVTCGNGIALLRAINTPSGDLAAPGIAKPDPLVRDLRITLGQLPPPLGEALRQVLVVGSGTAARDLVHRLEERFSEDGLQVTWVGEPAAGSLGVKLPPGTGISLPLVVAARHLAQQAPVTEFLPAHVSSWEVLAAKYGTSRQLATPALAVAAAVLLVLLAFTVQQVRLMYWRAKWNGMRAQVTELQDIEQRVRQFRPWFDESFRSLSILKRLTEAFPEEGTVSAKSVEVRASTGVTCTGTARDNAALLRTLDKLRSAPEVRALKVEQIRGNAPLQFTVHFQWIEAAAP